MPIRVVVVIAFRGDEGLLRWALEGYAQQRMGADIELEVRVGGDGCAVPAMPKSERVGFVGRAFPRMGAGGVRNHLLEGAAGEVVIFGNADARPEADCVQRHVDRLVSLPAGSMVLGAAPWEKPACPTVFDALLAETPMVFFYDQLQAGNWYNFRNCWTLNLSVRLEDFRKSGGFAPLLRPVYYEDLAMGYQMMGERKGVFYDDGPRVLHRHPTNLEQYLNREELLGLMAPVVHGHAPGVFRSLFGEKALEEMAAEFRMWVGMDGAMHRWIFSRLEEWSRLPEEAVGSGAERRRMLMTVYQMHVPLKRLAFRLGFLRGLELMGDDHWMERQPAGLWKGMVQGRVGVC